ncbi:MAG: hypothetical protein QOH66_1508 [Actinomycetota bacterium]|jgi:hypothetical protein|nr:hypothetical protein [Actinomycetota bacterium]
MSTDENVRYPGATDDVGAGQAGTSVVEPETNGASGSGTTVAPGSGETAAVQPIVLPSITSQDALVEAIKRGSALGVPLLLAPGTYFTMPGRNQRIAIGANGLQIRPSDPPQGAQPFVVKRPDLGRSFCP